LNFSLINLCFNSQFEFFKFKLSCNNKILANLFIIVFTELYLRNMIPKVLLSDFQYHLPEDSIRKYALKNRADSKLITYKNGVIDHHNFSNIINQLSSDTTLFFNDTKVIPARLHFTKITGALIEIFLLNPVAPSNLVVEAMSVTEKCTWICMIGNLKKWKNEPLTTTLQYKNKALNISVDLVDRDSQLVEFRWDSDISFAEVVEAMGEVPLPPYFHRKPEPEDKERYQTIYSTNKGAVAAPTAGLHFTDNILEKLKTNGVKLEYLTLHVSAGTFQPVKEEDATKHPMHSEQMIVTKNNLKALINSKKICAVGTTSMRTLESLYWFGVKMMKNDDEKFHVDKLEPYHYKIEDLPTRQNVFSKILDYMSNNQLEELRGDTEIFIMPGYQFQVCDALITNFHQSGSTLLMLIAAFIGDDWKKLYKEAMVNDYKFLSYGDSSLLMPKKQIDK